MTLMLEPRVPRWRGQIEFGAVKDPVAQTPISRLPLGRHLGEHRLVLIDVIINDHVALRSVQAMQSAGILGERSSPGDRHGQEQRIESRIIKALAEIATRR
jgi:hypothetical protein